ncbi:MAG: hypothetical protein KBD78_13580 [Oligoflexales bacterium]|nr:hypothetical protein [Oligoflexales bacterium]
MEKQKIRSHNHHPERVTLSLASLESVTKWTEQLKNELRGSKFTRNEMVNWIIGQRSSELTKSEVEDLRQLYFDPKKALAWALGQIKKAQKVGQEIDVNKLVQETLIAKKIGNKASVKLKRKQKNVEMENGGV